jgi:hypothetical protein
MWSVADMNFIFPESIHFDHGWWLDVDTTEKKALLELGARGLIPMLCNYELLS